MSKSVKGTLYIAAAGLAWGISGVSGQYLMKEGFSPLLLTNIRLLLSGLVLVALSFFRDRENFRRLLADRKALLGILIFALAGLLLNQYAYMAAIQETNAGTATVLQYLCPVGVLAYTCIRDRLAPTLMELLSMILAIGGTFLIATHGQLDQLSITPLGLFWGLFAAFSYALYMMLPLRLMKVWGSLPVIGLGMLFAGLVLTPFSGGAARNWSLTLDIYLAFAGLIFVGTIFSYTVFLMGTSILGPVKASLLASIEPIAAVFFAFLLLQERFYPVDLLGILLILLAVSLISVKDLLRQRRLEKREKIG